jgi:hypothetical protein
LTPKHRRRALLGGAALTAAAALIVLVRRTQNPGEGSEGSGMVRVFVNRDGQIREHDPGDTVSPGDALAFALEPPAPPTSHLVVLGRDASGAVKLYHPEDGTAAAPVQLTSAGSLPFSVQLDEIPGPEAFFFFVCAGPVPVDAVRASLLAPDDAAPPGCARHQIVLEKRPRP